MNTETELSALLSEFPRTLLTDVPGQAVLDGLVIRIAKVLPVSAAAVTLRTAGSDAVYVTASDRRALRLEQLQSELGEGPSDPVLASGTALSIPDLAADERMPAFGAQAVDSGFRAAFSFPLCEGDTPLGTLNLYVADPGPMDPRHLEIAQTLADVAAAYTLNAAARGDLLDAAAAARQSTVVEEEGVRALRASVRSNRRADVALDASEARNTAILASALDAVITLDDRGKVVDLNASAQRMFGYSKDEMCGRTMADLVIPPQGRPAHRQRWASLLANTDSPGVNVRTELTAMRADGSLFPAEVSSHVVHGPGPVLVTGFVRDLTAEKAAGAERADLEAQLQQSQRLESMGRLAGGVAHDFNNLLTVIIGYASSIAESSSHNEDARADAREILEAGARAARLTHQLLTFARRQPVRYGPVDLNAAVDDIQVLLSQTLGTAVKLAVHLADDLPAIHGDRGQTDQILLNLAGNARDAMPGGGLLTIRTRAITLDGHDPRLRPGMVPGEYVELCVEDTGEGMAPHVISHAFDPFFTTHPARQNSGLGLATVHGIVTDVGGTITLRSKVGDGTTVVALFPVDHSTAPPPVQDDGVGADSTGETILVVEDEPAVLDVTARMLRQHGYVVLEASSAADAVAVFDREQVDLLLTDVLMPEGSGQELAAALQAKDGGLAVLFMSGSIGDTFGTGPRLSTDLALLQKPFEAAALVSAVGASLHGRVVEEGAP